LGFRRVEPMVGRGLLRDRLDRDTSGSRKKIAERIMDRFRVALKQKPTKPNQTKPNQHQLCSAHHLRARTITLLLPYLLQEMSDLYSAQPHMWPKDRVWNSRDIPPCPKQRQKKSPPNQTKPSVVSKSGFRKATPLSGPSLGT
jgi:hypothetical protein